jgi:hypothetical protein
MLRIRDIWTVQQPAVFVRRWAVEAAGWVDPEVHFLMDVDLLLRVLRIGRFVFSDKVWANFRMWPESKTCFEGPPKGELEYIIGKHWNKHAFQFFVLIRALRNKLGVKGRMEKLFSRVCSSRNGINELNLDK